MNHHGHNDHPHDHAHAHHDTTTASGGISETHKVIKMVEHWIHHNEEHARSYRDWADRAREMGHVGVSGALEEIAADTLAQNQNFEKILQMLKSVPT